MTSVSKKRRASDVEDLDEAVAEHSPKASKKAKSAAASSTITPDGKDDDGNAFWEVWPIVISSTTRERLADLGPFSSPLSVESAYQNSRRCASSTYANSTKRTARRSQVKR